MNITKITGSPVSVTSLLKFVEEPENAPQCCQTSVSPPRMKTPLPYHEFQESYGFSIKYRPDLETEDLKNKIHDISTKVPNLFYGRYDIRFTDYKKLKKGEGFKILELNEDGSDTRYSETHSFFYNFKILINHFFTRIEFGILNIILLRSVNIIDTIKRLYENILRISERNHFSHYIHAFDKFKSIFVDSP